MLVDLLPAGGLVLAAAISAVVSTTSTILMKNREHLFFSYDLKFTHYQYPQDASCITAHFYNTTYPYTTDEVDEVDDGGNASEFIPSSENTASSEICSADTTMTPSTTDAASCWQVSDWSIFFTVISAVLFLTVFHYIIALYNFVAAWNLILEARRVDLAAAYNCRQRRRNVQDVLSTHVHVDKMNAHTSCPICLEDFYEQDLVTACDEGCGNYFHKECLFNWLEYHNTCACCRKDLISPKPHGWMTSIFFFLVGSPCQQPPFH
jgi:hypothetical protein